MGLLDDAIREHLELKRRHGGDVAEIDRQEQEALGPVRRTVDGSDQEAEEAVAAEADGPLADEVEPAPVEYEEPPEGGEIEVVEDHDPLPADEPATPGLADFGSDFDEASAAPPADDPSRPVADVEQPTEEWGFDDEEDKEEEPEPEEDPLEDTPDFLQETPEHDRLWFEQKPPKDFDFDQ